MQKLKPEHQAIFDAVKAALPKVTLDELDYGFTLVIHNPETDIAAYLVRAMSDWPNQPAELITYLLGETTSPETEKRLFVRRYTPKEVTNIIGDAIQTVIDRPH